MADCFYDKVAEKFGSYSTGEKHISHYPPGGNPEEAFKQKLIELGGEAKLVLDVGCADGRFTLSVAKHFGKIIGIDVSGGMLKAARRFQAESGIKNVEFVEQDARSLSYKDQSFDVVYNRRGPQDFPQFFRVLKKGGSYLEIRIGEKDCIELKRTFGRGQGYREWKQSALEKDSNELRNAGFEILFARDYYYQEFYPTGEDIDLFLQGVPIFEDYDSQKDRVNLRQYLKQYRTEEGIKLNRHRVVTLSRRS